MRGFLTGGNRTEEEGKREWTRWTLRVEAPGRGLRTWTWMPPFAPATCARSRVHSFILALIRSFSGSPLPRPTGVGNRLGCLHHGALACWFDSRLEARQEKESPSSAAGRPIDRVPMARSVGTSPGSLMLILIPESSTGPAMRCCTHALPRHATPCKPNGKRSWSRSCFL